MEAEILPCLEDFQEGVERRAFLNGLICRKRNCALVDKAPKTDKHKADQKVLFLVNESIRNYPQGDCASHLLGFVKRSGEASEGLELAFNKYLSSRPGEITARKDNQKRLLPSSLISYVPPEGGDSVQLTLDVTIQQALEKALDKRMEEVEAKVGLGIIMDPHTGAILALASRPAFDPNNYRATPAEARRNKATLNFFEPGSAFKIVTAAAVLEHGLVTPDTQIDCEGGFFNPYGHRIRDFYKLGVITVATVIEKSSNIGIIKLAAMLGPERLEEWIRLFGFGETTSPDFQFESRGLFRPRNKWSPLSMGSLPMGQEIAVTMPQLAKAFAVLANGGFVIQPYFIERAVNRDNKVTYQHQPPPASVFSEKRAHHAAIVPRWCFMARQGGQYPGISFAETGNAQMAYNDGIHWVLTGPVYLGVAGSRSGQSARRRSLSYRSPPKNGMAVMYAGRCLRKWSVML